MNKDRLWLIGAALGTVIVVVMGWFIGISPLVSQASAANASATSLNQANALSSTKLATLKTQFAGLETLQGDLANLRESVPTGADIPGFLTEINALCAKYDVALQSVVVNDAVVFQAPVAPTVAATPGSASTATPTPTPTASPAAGAAVPAAPADTSGGLVYVPVQISVTGDFQKVMNFAGGVQTGARLYLTSELQVAPGAAIGGGRPTKFAGVLSGNIYALAGTSGDLPASVTPVTSTPEPTPTDTATPDPTDTPTGAPTGDPTGTPTGTATTKP